MPPIVDARRGSVAAVVLAGGSGTRVGAGTNKVYLPLGGAAVVTWSFRWASRLPEVGPLVLVVRPRDADLAAGALQRDLPDLTVELVEGGASRHGSEEAALRHLAPRVASGEVEVVAVHDGARPLAGPALWRRVLAQARSTGGAVPGLPVPGLLPVDTGGGPEHDPLRLQGLHGMQTPQAFRAPGLLAAFDAARAIGQEGTDTAATVQEHGRLTVQLVPGSPRNLKLTYPHDLVLAEHLLAQHLTEGPDDGPV